MYKLLKIGGKDYKLEYGIEASLFDDCAKSVMNMLVSTSGGTDRSLKEMVSGMSSIPNTALNAFYAGSLIKVEPYWNYIDSYVKIVI